MIYTGRVMHSDEDISGPLQNLAGHMPRKDGDFEIRPLAEMERAYIETVIAFCGGNIPSAARVLEVSASTLYRKKQAWEQQDAKG